jgi:hypothetical protein
MERRVTAFFRKQLKLVEHVMGKGLTYNSYLLKIAKQLIGAQFEGVYSQNTVPLKLPTRCMFILNQDVDTGKGIHWISVYKNGKTYYIYDSFGRTSKRLVPLFVNQILGENCKYIDSDHDPEQFGYKSENCGQLCLTFLLCVKRLGINNALLI